MIFAYILTAIVSAFCWFVIHEMSHVLMVKSLLGAKYWKIMPYPHMNNGTFYWARCVYTMKKLPTDTQAGVISLAPRIPGLLAATMLLAALAIPGPTGIFLGIFLIGGIVDLIVGSLGIGEKSDLQKASKRLNCNPWIIRAAGLVVATVSMAFAIISLCV